MGENPNNSSPPGDNLDFQSHLDQAWYAVKVILEKEALIVKYTDFSDDDKFDEKFKAEDFKDCKELEDFVRKRFRPTCEQLQDDECMKVVPGMIVSASFEFGIDDIRFYNAKVINKVVRDHLIEEGEEVCTCKFRLSPLNGPKVGNVTLTNIENVCLIQSGDVLTDPILDLFLKMSKEKLDEAWQDPYHVSEGDILTGDASTTRKRSLDSIYKSTPVKNKSKACSTWNIKSNKESFSLSRNSKGPSTDYWDQDMDLGGKCHHTEDLKELSTKHFMLIDNLDEDLSPFAIVDFINKHVSVSSQAQLFPCLSSESYTRGIIAVDSQEELQKVADFLHSPAHIILSSRGRPWVPEKKLRRGVVEGPARNLATRSKIQPWDKGLEFGRKIELFHSGSEEYKRGKQVREAFLRLEDDKRSLHRLFVSEEMNILRPPNAPCKGI